MEQKDSPRFFIFLILAAIPLILSWPTPVSTLFSPATSVFAQKALLSQTYIDSTIFRALYTMNEAATFAGVGYKHKESIEEARKILINLQQKGKGDPNESYIKWKVSELEAQIRLEEDDLRLIEQERKMLTSNQLVLQYNAEVGKNRPDFAKLKGTFRRMSEVDARQANNLADNYNKRYRQISREAVFSLEKAIMTGDLDLAKKELDYCENNKFNLMISQSRLAKLKEQCEKLESARSDVPRIEAALAKGEQAALELRLSESRNSLTMARDRLTELRGDLPQQQWVSLSSKADRHIRLLDNREDSLVRVTLRILEQKGHEEAGRYVREVLYKMGLSRDRTAFIDRTIINTRSPEDPSQAQKKIVEDYPEEDEHDKTEMIDDMRAIARKRAQEKTDSIQAITDAQRVVAARKDSLRREADRKTQMQLRINQDRAARVSLDIYNLLEKNKMKEAKKLFAKEKQLLSSYLFENAFEMLELSVKYGSEQTTPATTSPSAPKQPPQTVAQISNQPPKPADDKTNHDKAKERAQQIYSLLERNQIREAYERFQKDRAPLQRYMEKDAFEMLEITVVQSFNYLSN